ncbi:MAG TPA: dihydrodipicolinate synthase family protein [Chloroflexota bacterium]|nr:dihydrodipicolinate synthase family protein [Chloroflexota bacterium]
MEGKIRGIFPIVYTPFDAEGRIDEEDLGQLVEYLIAAGTHGLAAVGGASECHKLTVAERKWLASETVAAARGRVPVLVGVSATCVGDAVDLARHAEEIGAVGVFGTPPLYGPVTPGALEAHFGALARAVSLPILIQDAQVTIPPPQIAHLGSLYPNLRWVKEEAADSGHRISELRRICTAGVSIMSGGSYLLDDLTRGAIGAIPGSIGVADLALAFDRYQAGNLTGARAAYNHFLPLSFWRRQFPLLAAKEVLRRAGVFKSAHLRQPANDTLDSDDLRELSIILETMGPPY